MNFFVPIIIIGVLLLITVLLLVIDTLIGNDADHTVTINDEQVIHVNAADTLLNTLNNEKIFLPSACGGKATCGACKFKLIDGGPEMSPVEAPLLSPEEQENNVRLACQTKVRSSMKIEVMRELLNAQEYSAKVTAIEDLTYDIKLVRLELIEPRTMDFKPGQYAQIRVPGMEIERAYSIASNPKHNNIIEFIIRLVPKGKATTFVHKALENNDDITITGPYGDFFLQEDSSRDIICIAGGSGKAPIRSILQVLKDQNMPRKVRYFFGARTQDDLYMTDEFKALEQEFPNFEYIPALSHADDDETWDGEKGLITEVVAKYYNDLSNQEAYLCGSPGMIDACIDVLTDKDLDESHIFYDKFS
ncbi:NADH:ubiquinone reductase (Na(+)-transporting) subunit F [Candidatus Xianfuyuplasma coldseepsis]|uniref:2Fe-2S iron-sulfur cluster binding domain-containing protein n=1 Tax=Candidatus Xianfuyuplasma coldseepsis TaxID=2782163 RepID=A0A7L7KT91_9MOLU|nr:2Fe-2S iron-sulfur cluster binding domain-containing protein [Xianfuyuplasma coldseepsis]QMS85456.1 2Fe-2S iron-sulfur cluster binding domain-containing protein [Xianfuyuplasma coldseepsis]